MTVPAPATGSRWELFPHDADVGVRGIGATRDAAFEQVALALTGVITDPDTVSPDQAVALRCEAPDDEILLLDWLNALVYEMAIRRMLFGRFAVHTTDHRLEAQAWGEPVDPPRHRPAAEVKGATLTAARVAREEGGLWVAQCVVDV